jgi:hypothetical protein
MRKLLSTVAMVAVLASAAGAHAATMLFQFDAANSSIDVTQNNTLCFGSCALSANLATPFTSLNIAEGASQSFDFANFHLSGGSGLGSAHVQAVLAFDAPDVGPASTGGSAGYITAGGTLTLGGLVWDNPFQSFTTADGSNFTVHFDDLAGFAIGSTITDKVTITVNSIGAGAVPEPASWALMIGGFGMAGAMLRRRRAGAAFA